MDHAAFDAWSERLRRVLTEYMSIPISPVKRHINFHQCLICSRGVWPLITRPRNNEELQLGYLEYTGRYPLIDSFGRHITTYCMSCWREHWGAVETWPYVNKFVF
jgi:hypothetical protein